jgi:2,3-bisphosphoglycerate-independent phosphoglycerate mutase
MSPIPAGPDGIPVPSLALVILDGWGIAPDGPGNAISLASTPVFDELWGAYPHTSLSTSGRDVGLPDGQMGNSEVGHLNLGAGAVVKQDLARIDDAIADGSFFENPALRAACGSARESRRGRLHAIGLISDGGVHSGWEHIEAVIELAGEEGVSDLVLHALTDGRDTPPTAGAAYVEEVERWLRHIGRIGTVGGRYWGMDRDRRWDRTKRAYDTIVHARAPRADAPVEAIRESYERGITDEFIEPVVIDGRPRLEHGDSAIFFNFRPDRARQLTQKLLEASFDLTTMTRYRDDFDCPVVFEEREVAETMAEVLAEHGVRQLHVAETEKYAHVTYFFNGGREGEWEGETRILVPSPQDVATYDQKPEMSAAEVVSRFEDEIGNGYRFAVVNFANPDMVGHSGVIPAVVRAVETVDGCLARAAAAVARLGGVCLVTADHGNAEEMLEPDGQSPHTAHTTNPVPLIVTIEGATLAGGGTLSDLVPTCLSLLGIPPSAVMTGRDLVTNV